MNCLISLTLNQSHQIIMALNDYTDSTTPPQSPTNEAHDGQEVSTTPTCTPISIQKHRKGFSESELLQENDGRGSLTTFDNGKLTLHEPVLQMLSTEG